MTVVCCMLAAACTSSDGPTGLAADKQRVAAYLQTLLIDRNWAEWPAYFADDAKINGSDFAQQLMRSTADGLNYSFAELQLHVVDQVAEPGHVATFFVLEGRHQHPFNDQPATNRRVRLDGFVIDRFDNHRVVESRLFLDVWGLSQRVAAAGASPR